MTKTVGALIIVVYMKCVLVFPFTLTNIALRRDC